MVSMVERMFEIANELIANRPRSAAARRRAVSTAYYATFHALAKTCANALLTSDASDEVYEKAYRALDHGAVRSALQKPGYLKSSPPLREILQLVDELRIAREDCDYAPPDASFMSLSIAREHVRKAEDAVTRLDALDHEQSAALAAGLLMKSRQDRRG